MPSVFQLVQGQQTPQVLPLRARGEPLVPSAEAGVPPKATAPSADALRVNVIGGDGSSIAALPDVVIAGKAGEADLIWNRNDGSVEHVVGGRVAENVDATAMIPIVAKWATLKWLRNHATGAPGEFILRSGNQRYKPGEKIDVSFSGAERAYITLFNLAPDGRVEFFVEPDEVNIDWRGRTANWTFTPQKPPFGAEHLVALFTDEPMTRLHAALRSMSSAERAVGLRGIIEAALAGKAFQFGVASIYTGAADEPMHRLAAIAFIIAMAAGGAMAGERALLIGIDSHADSRLNAKMGTPAVNDVTAIRSLLMAKFGYAARDIRVLTNGAATAAAIRDGLAIGSSPAAGRVTGSISISPATVLRARSQWR